MTSAQSATGDLILAAALNYWRYAAIGPPGSGIRRLSMAWTWERHRARVEFLVSGWWGELGCQDAAVFVRHGELRVAIDGDEWPLDHSLSCRVRRGLLTTKFVLLRDGVSVSRSTYRTPPRPWQHYSDWPLDRADYDFGYFIARIIGRRMQAPPLESIWPFPRRLDHEPPALA